MRTPNHETVRWRIVDIIPETTITKTLVLSTQDERPVFIAGQYLTVKLPGFEPTEGKSYSISSTPREETLSLTIKEMGVFSRALLDLTIGDTIVTSHPYGFFYPEPPYERDLVCIAGGIGITPIISILETLVMEGFPHHATLFYSNRTEDDIVFRERLSTLAQKFPLITLNHFITRAQGNDPERYYRRITAHDVHMHLKNPNSADIFICGSMHFTRDIWRDLRASGVESSRIYTEGFF